MSEKKYPIGYYAPGNYHCTCCDCGGKFLGDKRAVQCEPCAVANKQKFDALTPEEQKELMQRNAEAIKEVFKNWGKKCICNEPYDSERHEGGYPRCPVHDKAIEFPKQAGAVWVKASDRLPGIRALVKWRIGGEEWELKETTLGMWYNKPNDFHKYEWLDEGTAAAGRG